MILILSSQTNVVIVYTFCDDVSNRIYVFFSSENFANETGSEFWRQSRNKCNQTKQDETEFIERNWRFYNKCCAPDKLNWCLENRIFGPRAHSNVCIQHHDVFSGLPMNKLWLIIKWQINGRVDMEQLVNTEHAHALLNQERAYANQMPMSHYILLSKSIEMITHLAIGNGFCIVINYIG